MAFASGCTTIFVNCLNLVWFLKGIVCVEIFFFNENFYNFGRNVEEIIQNFLFYIYFSTELSFSLNVSMNINC